MNEKLVNQTTPYLIKSTAYSHEKKKPFPFTRKTTKVTVLVVLLSHLVRLQRIALASTLFEGDEYPFPCKTDLVLAPFY